MRTVPKAFIWLVVASGLFTSGLLAGYLLSHRNDQQTSYRFLYSANNSPYTFINPLLDCEISEQTIRTPFKLLRNQIVTLVDQLKQEHNLTTASVYVRDLYNGDWFGIDEKEKFSPASLMKVPVLMGVLKQSESDPGLLDRELTLTSVNYEAEQNIEPTVSLEPGKSYPVRTLLTYLVDESSNNAIRPLLAALPDGFMGRVYADVGIPPVAGNDAGTYFLEVRTYASLFRTLFNASYLSRDNSELALKLLSQTRFNNGIVAGVPANITVAHKFGERLFLDTNTRQLHDCGIVYYPGHPYLLCVMTKGDSYPEMEKAITTISRAIYTQINSQGAQLR